MKKIIVAMVCLLLVGCGVKEENEILKFKEEYEALNETSVQLEIDSNAKVSYLEADETYEFLTKKTGIIYFGFPSCPWCRNILPILLEVAKENNMTVYYYNSSNLKTEDEEVFSNIMTVLYDHLIENSEGTKTLYVPDVYFVKDGNIVGHHLGSASSQEDPYVELTDEQKEELKKIYSDFINQL